MFEVLECSIDVRGNAVVEDSNGWKASRWALLTNTRNFSLNKTLLLCLQFIQFDFIPPLKKFISKNERKQDGNGSAGGLTHRRQRLNSKLGHFPAKKTQFTEKII
jgi:hypothetical protein